MQRVLVPLVTLLLVGVATPAAAYEDTDEIDPLGLETVGPGNGKGIGKGDEKGKGKGHDKHDRDNETDDPDDDNGTSSPPDRNDTVPPPSNNTTNPPDDGTTTPPSNNTTTTPSDNETTLPDDGNETTPPSEPQIPAMVLYAQENDDLIVGLRGVGVDPLDKDTFRFTANDTHPDIRFQLDFTPKEASAEHDGSEVALLYELRVDLTNAETGILESRHHFFSAGSGRHVANIATNTSVEYIVDVYLMTGADVDWTMNVQGWRLPQTL